MEHNRVPEIRFNELAPTHPKERFTFDSANGRRQGSITVQFSDGLPQCVFFFDFPTTCRTPSRRIITAYENGRYRDQ